MPHRLLGLSTPIATPDPHGEQVIAQQTGEAVPEASHMALVESSMTPDKAPSNAPIWYQLAANGSFATLICAMLLWFVLNAPSAERIQANAAQLTEKLIDRTIAGQEKLLDKQERVIDRQEKNTESIKEIFKRRDALQTIQLESYLQAAADNLKKAEKYHEEANKARELQNRLLEEQTLLLKKIAEKK